MKIKKKASVTKTKFFFLFQELVLSLFVNSTVVFNEVVAPKSSNICVTT